MKTTLLITDAQCLKSASHSGGTSIPVYDDGSGPLFILRCSIGINSIVRAQTWEDAYSICEDEFFPEASETAEELQKEYGFKREHKKVISCNRPTPIEPHLAAFEKFAELADYEHLSPTAFIRYQLIETPDPDSWIENALFQEAYGFRPNGPNAQDVLNHGIYARDLNGDYLDLVTPKLLARLGITLGIEEEN